MGHVLLFTECMSDKEMEWFLYEKTADIII